MDANRLRRAFTGYFEQRGHVVVPSASLVPTDPGLLFTIAGMVPFKPWFMGEEAPAHKRATSIQRCLRAGGKHNDLDAIGTTARHLTLFEMLGNFSFGDYFKEAAIPYAWECATEVLGFDPSRIWVTVHHSDDQAAEIWTDSVGLPRDRLQRMGDDNWWQMGDTGPCGPCSELYFDKGPSYGAEGGPLNGGDERYVEFWNLVFMQYSRLADGRLVDLPKPSIDTGAGFERILTLAEGTDSVFETAVLRPVLAKAESLSGRRYGSDPRDDVALRIVADHARAMSFLVSDGVFPTNEGRGHVLRRIIRRSVLRSSQLGVAKDAMPRMVDAVVDVMGEAYPLLRATAGFVKEVVAREEDRFRATLRAGSLLLEEHLGEPGGMVPGDVAFRLHDTFGFPVELTREVAAERGIGVDQEGFEAAMSLQRETSRAAGTAAAASSRGESYRELLEQFGTTRFVGYDHEAWSSKVVAVLPGSDGPAPGEAAPGEVEVFLDATPFYAEGGGQVGDTGLLSADGLEVSVLDTTAPMPGLHRHRAVVRQGELRPGMTVTASVDAERRNAIRRNHTGTHLLHWALRKVLGEHVRQQGSLVAPDRLRFDFSHHSAPDPSQLEEVENLVNAEVLADLPVTTTVTSRVEAEGEGAIAFFGDRYGEQVRVVRSGSASVELCGGTHVRALGMVGPIRIVSEGSIGSNTRRLEALTGEASISRWRAESCLLSRAAAVVNATPDELPARVEELRVEQKRAREELRVLRSRALADEAANLASLATDGTVVVRRDGRPNDELRELATAIRQVKGVRAAVVIGSPDGSGVALVAAVDPGSGLTASELIGDAARAVGGGGGRGVELAMAGGRRADKIDDAIATVRSKLESA
ncbi:MAG: alanine--tRNA ligase [Actinomycetota bacterium]|nr:alanine--tRNA ligase [Actinomycetota bacterium]